MDCIITFPFEFVLCPYSPAELRCEGPVCSQKQGEREVSGMSREGLWEGYTLLIEGREMCISSVVRGEGQSSEAN